MTEQNPVSGQGYVPAFLDLVDVVARLRAPDGCPWDREQTHESVARNITEEAAETVDAIEAGDLDGLKEELGDLLLQVLLQSQIAVEAGEFDLKDVMNGIAAKLVRRHPHVFGIEAALDAMELTPEKRKVFEQKAQGVDSPEEVLDLWDSIKLLEREQIEDRPGLLDSVPRALPALMQAQDISRKAISAGFDWTGSDAVWHQFDLELDEFRAEVRGSRRAAEEFGDVLFTLVNVGIKEGIDAESALRGTVNRFRQRWALMEGYASGEGGEISDYPVEKQEAFWQRAKDEIARTSGGV